MTVMPQFDFSWNDAPADYFGVGGYIIEFGDLTTSSADVVIASANNISTANITVGFLNCSPNHIITSRDTRASPPQRVEFHFALLRERAANGSVLKVFNFSEATFFAQHQPPSKPTGTQQFYFTATIPYANGSASEPRVSFAFTLFDDATIVPYAGSILSIPASSVKWEMQVYGWRVTTGHTLELDVYVAAAPSIVSAWESIDAANSTVEVLLEMTDGSLVSLLLPTRVLADANTTLLLTSMPTYDMSTSLLQFIFPAFGKTLIYDPSAAILLGTGGSGPSSPDAALPIGLSVGLTALALGIIMAALLFLAVLVIYYKVVKPRANLKSINWNGAQQGGNTLM